MTTIELQIHITTQGKPFINPEKMRLLKQVALKGGLLKASEELGISYNKGWKLLESLNESAPQPLVKKSRGGQGGGGAFLTEYGQMILKEYTAIQKVVDQFTKKLNTEINL